MRHWPSPPTCARSHSREPQGEQRPRTVANPPVSAPHRPRIHSPRSAQYAPTTTADHHLRQFEVVRRVLRRDRPQSDGSVPPPPVGDLNGATGKTGQGRAGQGEQARPWIRHEPGRSEETSPARVPNAEAQIGKPRSGRSGYLLNQTSLQYGEASDWIAPRGIWTSPSMTGRDLPCRWNICASKARVPRCKARVRAKSVL